MTMDEHKSPEAVSLVELIEEVLQGTASDAQKEQLQTRLLTSVEDRRLYLHHLNLHSALRRRFAFDAGEEAPAQLDPASGGRAPGSAPSRPTPRLARWAWAAIASAVVVLIAIMFFQRPSAERPIARITGLSGALQWTGDGGRVVRDLSIGTILPGGTIEGMVPEAWFELRFNDGSTIAISGNSMLTFSENGQKKLHLKEGNLSANVKPQPAGRPMLIYTRSALLEVLGTQFEVDAEFGATTLSVSKGTVRIKRLSDGAAVDVPSRHRAIAAADREMLSAPIPASVNHWRSQLSRGPEGTLGRWLPPSGEQGARIGTVPYTVEQGWTIFLVSFGVSRGDRSPVIVIPGARLRVRGRMTSSHRVWFGLTVRGENGEFAGKFQAIRPADEFPAGKTFEALLDLRDFRLDPTLSAWKDKLPGSPFHLVLESTWCHTLGQQAGLEVAEIELIPPVEEK
jgi:ferric-dicitrate binding protein FerR (iron transport regulator)